MRSSSNQHPLLRQLFILFAAVMLVTIVAMACNMPSSEDSDATQEALNTQAAQLADQGTQIALTQTAVAAETDEDLPEEEPDYAATSVAQQATQTALDLQATQNAQNQAEPTTAPPTPTPTLEPTQAAQDPQLPDFETWMRDSASILLFEDMAGDFSVYRYIKNALDGMSLNYVDVKDALGHYKDQILSNGPGGKGWDLIISGKELRTGVQGEFYVYLNDALNLGSAVIIEEWDMDSIASGKLATILNRCGVRFQRDWINEPVGKQLLFPLNGSHPIHHYPNEGISLTNPTGYWNWTDLGDLMRLAPGSQAKILWVNRSNVNDSYATAVVCLDGQLIIQTHSSHSYGQNRVEMMWQNYIYNALQARYQRLNQ